MKILLSNMPFIQTVVCLLFGIVQLDLASVSISALKSGCTCAANTVACVLGILSPVFAFIGAIAAANVMVAGTAGFSHIGELMFAMSLLAYAVAKRKTR